MSFENGDRLSRLPEEIAAHILSLMPTKFAVRTSILSKRWRYTWMFVTNIDIDIDIEVIYPIQKAVDSLTKFMDRVLKLRKSPQLQLFRLHHHGLGVLSSNVSNWIDEAVRLNVCELDIRAMRLPLSMFTCKTLTILRLDHCDGQCVWDCPSFVNLPCLKTLDINAIYTNPSFNAFKLIRGCPVLETLYLVVWYDDDVDYIFDIPTLRRLKLWREAGYHTNKVVLHTPNLEYLIVGGVLDSLFVMKDVLSLVEASLSIRALRSYHLWFELLKGINGVKSLMVQNTTSFVLKIPFTSPLPIFPNMKHLELKGFWHPVRIAQFLESSPELKHLCIGKLSEHFIKDPKEFIGVEPKVIPGCMLTNLTTIKFQICNWEKCDMQFLEYILGNTGVLKTVTVRWDDLSNIKEETWLYRSFFFNGNIL